MIRKERLGSDFYHVSEAELDGKVLSPRIPSNTMVDNGFENNKVARVSFSPTIMQCILAIPRKKEGMILHVYKPSKEVLYIKPRKKDVPDIEHTEEIWVIQSVKLKKVSTIRLIEDLTHDGFKYKYGPMLRKRETITYPYKYEVISDVEGTRK